MAHLLHVSLGVMRSCERSVVESLSHREQCQHKEQIVELTLAFQVKSPSCEFIWDIPDIPFYLGISRQVIVFTGVGDSRVIHNRYTLSSRY